MRQLLNNTKLGNLQRLMCAQHVRNAQPVEKRKSGTREVSCFTHEGCIPSTEDAEDPLPIATPEQKFRASLEGFGSRHEEPERIGQPIRRVKRQADRERVLDLLARDTGRQQSAHVVRIYCVLACQLAQHAQRCPKWLLNGRGLEIGKYCGDFRFIVICSRCGRRVRCNAKCARIDLRDKCSHQLAVANRQGRRSAHRLMGELLHRRAVEIGAVKD